MSWDWVTRPCLTTGLLGKEVPGKKQWDRHSWLSRPHPLRVGPWLPPAKPGCHSQKASLSAFTMPLAHPSNSSQASSPDAGTYRAIPPPRTTTWLCAAFQTRPNSSLRCLDSPRLASASPSSLPLEALAFRTACSSTAVALCHGVDIDDDSGGVDEDGGDCGWQGGGTSADGAFYARILESPPLKLRIR